MVYQYSGDGLRDVQQLARRLLVNVLLANGDAHLKNWSLTYPDQITPRLSPAYDIVTTRVYIRDEREMALNLGKNRLWYNVNLNHFKQWADKSGFPWRAIEPHLQDTIEKARILWPDALQHLPMADTHKQSLKDHWRLLTNDFRINT